MAPIIKNVLLCFYAQTRDGTPGKVRSAWSAYCIALSWNVQWSINLASAPTATICLWVWFKHFNVTSFLEKCSNQDQMPIYSQPAETCLELITMKD